MANNTRMYVVTEVDITSGETLKRRLVRAGTPAQAIRHVVEPRFTAEVATTDDVAFLVGNGTKVEDAKAE